MSEYTISISSLSEFDFCGASIYFHALDGASEKTVYQSTDQLNGSAAHKAVDTASYSTSSSILQGIAIYCEKYGLFGKIDVFDVKSGCLRERKKKIKTVYDGYVFQLYAQYFALSEMGYSVKKLCLYSMDDNKTYNIPFPEEDGVMLGKFEKLIFDMKNFSFDTFEQTNAEKCRHCIYEPLCSFSRCKEYE